MDLTSPDQPLLSLLLFAGGAYLLYLWYQDLRNGGDQTNKPGTLPGAFPAGRLVLIIGVAGALFITLAETAGEYLLDIVEEQSTLRFWFLFAGLGAAVIEEIIFRGYLVIRNRGPWLLVASILGFSLLFALLHPHLWEWGEDGLGFHFTAKAWFSTAFLFIASVFFYALRFLPCNPGRSLLPCFIAHAVMNLAVFGIKAGQGFIIWG